MNHNLLLNPGFEFHSFVNHREGKRESFRSSNAAFWNTDAWGDITVTRESHVDAKARPEFAVGNLVRIAPGRKLWQFIALPDAGLGHGDTVSLLARGYQSAGNVLRARIRLLAIDHAEGEWIPKELGMASERSFKRRARGELVTAKVYEVAAPESGRVTLRIENAEIIGKEHPTRAAEFPNLLVVGAQVEFENTDAKAEAWVCAPSLCVGPTALEGLPPAREMKPVYRHIPRTIQKLWKGEPIHIIVMGSSIDRGSANPAMYFYDEDPDSPTFKQPLAEGNFDAARAGRPDLDGYVGQWRHYFSYAGRLRLELMRKFNLPVSAICLNFMACDGSSIAESHSGLAEYCALSLPPKEEINGYKQGGDWRTLHPGLFEQPEGPGPDLIIYGSGANEKTDTPDEVAVFEGAIRWIQRHYPNAEFLFCMHQNEGGYTPNTGDLQALALRYQIPMLDYGLLNDQLGRWLIPTWISPGDGHPQAAAHYLWFKTIERAFECWDPIETGQVQRRLPERAHRNTYGWEGEMRRFAEGHPRLRGGRFVFEDTAINCWATADAEKIAAMVNGDLYTERITKHTEPNNRNCSFRHGRRRLGDRHILEMVPPEARLVAVDAKVCPERRFFGVEHSFWRLEGRPEPFASEWGAPYGERQVLLAPGQSAEITLLCTDLSIAWVDQPEGGTLRVTVDGVERLAQPTNHPFIDNEKRAHFMENRKGILGLAFGMHAVRVTAEGGPVRLLGVFTYDSRPNRETERRIVGHAAPGESVTFQPPFKATPFVICHGDLRIEGRDAVTPEGIRFTGTGAGTFEAIGE